MAKPRLRWDATGRATDGAVTRHELRPDIFGPPPSEAATASANGEISQAVA